MYACIVTTAKIGQRVISDVYVVIVSFVLLIFNFFVKVYT